MQPTLDQVLKLAPDESSAKAAKGLATVAKWPLLGRSEAALWGECQGSGAKPYQVQVDCGGPAFRCTCPSRKLPCKHGLALMLLSLQQAGAFANTDPPAWVVEWLASRQQRMAKQAAKATDPPAAESPNAGKRAGKRLERMAAGAGELRCWLADQVRHGLGPLAGAEQDWRTLTARMVDAQAPGLAFQVKQLAEIAGSGGDWPARLLAAMGRLQLLLEAFANLDRLPPETQADVRAALGWPADKEEVLARGERLADTWNVLGCVLDENERLWERRVWLRGRDSGRYALLLDFAHGRPVFEQHFLVGSALGMTLAYYPGAQPCRAVPADRPVAAGNGGFTADDEAAEWAALAAGIAAQPWQSPRPLALPGAVPVLDGGGWALYVVEGGRLPLALAGDDGWRLLALGGGVPLGMFGEWDGERLRPLSAWTPGLAWIGGGGA